MGILSGQLAARRFRVDGELPSGFREVYRDQLNSFAFREPPYQSKEEVEGWVHLDEMMNTSFDNLNRWLVQDYILMALRIDMIRLPAKRFKAELKRRTQDWCEERGVERCPGVVRTEIKERLEEEWIRQSMPTSRVVGLVWNIHTNVLYIESHSDPVCDRIRKRFFRTFGRRMVPFSPLDWIEEEKVADQLLCLPPSFLTATSSGESNDHEVPRGYDDAAPATTDTDGEE